MTMTQNISTEPTTETLWAMDSTYWKIENWREAMRAIERHGGAVILERAFTGFTALPAPGAKRDWREVFGFASDMRPTREAILAAYRRLRSEHHPDRGGSAERFDEVERAYREATQA